MRGEVAFMSKEIMKKIEKIVEWLRQQVQNSDTKGLVVGVSGGIDSALLSFLIKKAFPDNSLGVILPCKSSPKDQEDALKVVNACNIEYVEVDLTKAHESILDQVNTTLQKKESLGEINLKSSDSNLRARLRMSAIYAIANAKKYLVVGTDNAAEYYTGYFTKYGDGGVDILPIRNLTKREVRQWSEAMGVPKEIIQKTPSAGLWEGQTDEKEMGTTYDMVDDFLEGREIPQKDKEIIMRLHKISEHKRVVPPAPPKL